jgi:hypothetical protein
VTVFRNMVRKVTLKPFTSVAIVSPASLSMEDIGFQFSKELLVRQIEVTWTHMAGVAEPVMNAVTGASRP